MAFRWPFRREVKSTYTVGGFADASNFSGANAIGAVLSGGGEVSGLSAYHACIRLIAGTISTMPVEVTRPDADGVMVIDRNHPVAALFRRPNFDLSRVEFMDTVAADIEAHGNFYADISRRDSGAPVALSPIKPLGMTVRRAADRRIMYQWRDEFGVSRTAYDRDILHIRAPGGDALGGASTLTRARRIFDTALSADRATNATFANGLRPSGVIKAKSFLTDDQRDTVERHITPKFAGVDNAGKLIVLEGDLEFEPIAISPADAQLIESRGFSVAEIARWFGVPPFMIGHDGGASNWGTGLTEQTMGFRRYTLGPRIGRITGGVERCLLTPAEIAAGYQVQLNEDALLKADVKTRSEVSRGNVAAGIWTVNEARARDNMRPVPGGDEPRVQSQNITLTEATGEGRK